MATLFALLIALFLLTIVGAGLVWAISAACSFVAALVSPEPPGN